MARQTFKDFCWLVTDDCGDESALWTDRAIIRTRTGHTGGTVLYRFPPYEPQQGNTQARNMAHLLDEVASRKGVTGVVVCEDDDYYAPDHLATMNVALQCAELVGQRTSYYFNVRTMRYKELTGTYHASLGATALQGRAVELLREICRRQTDRLDVTLWRDFKGHKALLDTRTAVGIKGMPGRAGIGVGHRDTFGQPDNGDKLREWIGDYAEAYL